MNYVWTVDGNVNPFQMKSGNIFFKNLDEAGVELLFGGWESESFHLEKIFGFLTAFFLNLEIQNDLQKKI